MESLLPPTYNGPLLLPDVESLLEILAGYGFTYQSTGLEDKTLNIYFNGRRCAYINASTARYGGIVGYHFAPWGRPANDCPTEFISCLGEEFQRRYNCKSEDVFVQIGAGSNSGRRFLIIKNPIVALKVLCQDAGVCVGVETDIARYHTSLPRDFTMTEKIVIAASKVRQGTLVLYTTSIKVKDLVSEGFYSVETLDPENLNDKGYQRLLNKARAKKLADYIVKGQESQDAFLPTSVFLATDKHIPFEATSNTIEICVSSVGPFSVVDGQHRLEGLKMAAERDERVLEFEVPVNIAINLPKIAQMCHFLIVNTTQKSVDKSVEQRIIARLSDALDIEDNLPSLPKWILNTVEKGEVEKAVKYVDYLNESVESPWIGKIKMANSGSDDATINQRSFVKAIVKYVLTANNPLSAIVKDFEKEKKIFLNYWKAIATILDDGNSTVLYKYNGVELFCKFSIPFFIKLQDRGSFTVSSMEALLRSCFENVEGEYAGVGHPDWWAKGGKASFLNAGAINVVSQEMTKALHKSSSNGAIEI